MTGYTIIISHTPQQTTILIPDVFSFFVSGAFTLVLVTILCLILALRRS